jgi:predicted RNase H-like HicB family nuclease
MAPIVTCPATNDACTYDCTPDWRPQSAYRCHVCIIREDDGSFSAVALNLPGAGSCRNTEEDALRNAEEAIHGVIESHRDAGEDIPWQEVANCDIPTGAKLKWILVNA